MPSSYEWLWSRTWERAQNISDESLRPDYIRIVTLPYFRDLEYPEWFHTVIVNFTRGVLSTGRPYTLEEVVTLLEATYGISPAFRLPPELRDRAP